MLLDSEVSDGNAIILPDGRKLGYTDWGPDDGKIILFFPGIPCSRFFRFGHVNLLGKLGIKLYVLERPGYGLSDPKPGRSITDWTNDVSYFIDVLNLNKVSIAGYSGGGPYALACSHYLTDRITGTAVICGCDPHFKSEVHEKHTERIKNFANLIKSNPEEALKTAADLNINPKKITDELIGAASERDRKIFSSPEINSMFLANFIEGTRAHSEGPEYAREFLMLFEPWNFPYTEIQNEVHLWYGLQDKNEFHSPTYGKYLSGELPNSKLHLFEDEGASILWSRSEEILRCLL